MHSYGLPIGWTSGDFIELGSCRLWAVHHWLAVVDNFRLGRFPRQHWFDALPVERQTLIASLVSNDETLTVDQVRSTVEAVLS